MKLFYKKTGEGKPVMILHGLFGLGDNWNSVARSMSEKGFACYCVDLRNHGRSGHSFDFNYDVMCEDVAKLIRSEDLTKVDLIGHSLGGKILMFFSEKYLAMINRMIVVDMSPRYYPPHHQSIITALNSFNPGDLSNRREAEEILRASIKEESTVQFLLKNLYWNENEKLDWRFGLKEIEANIENIGQQFSPANEIDIDVLFLRGDRSGYINDEDAVEIKNIYPRAIIQTIPNAGHWVHADNPPAFLEAALSFLGK